MTAGTTTVIQVVRQLEAVGVPYMIAGSMASSFHGRPRTTHDADIVIDPTQEALDLLVVKLFAAGFYVDSGERVTPSTGGVSST